MLSSNFSDNNTLFISNENQLHKSVQKYLSKTDLLYTSCADFLAGEETRMKAKSMSYTNGTPDVLILTSCSGYAGFALEYKTPTGDGVLSEVQHHFCKELVRNNWFVLISNDYTLIIECIIKYINNLL
jgi:hypothetical protein